MQLKDKTTIHSRVTEVVLTPADLEGLVLDELCKKFNLHRNIAKVSIMFTGPYISSGEIVATVTENLNELPTAVEKAR
jgi:hypothetical protein